MLYLVYSHYKQIYKSKLKEETHVNTYNPESNVFIYETQACNQKNKIIKNYKGRINE